MKQVADFAKAMISRYPLLFAGNVGLGLFVTAVDSLAIFSLAPFVATLVGKGGDSPIVTYFYSIIDIFGLEKRPEVFLLVIGLLTILKSLFQIGIQYFVFWSRFRVSQEMIIDSASTLLFSSVNFMNRQKQGGLINTLNQEITNVSDAFTFMSLAISPIIQLLVIVSVPLFISWETTASAVFVGLMLTLPLNVLNKYANKLGESAKDSRNNYTAMLQETFSKTRIIAGFGHQSATLDKINYAFNDIISTAVKQQVLTSSITALYEPIGIISVVVAFFVGTFLKIGVADIAVIVYAINRAYGLQGMIAGYKLNVISLYPSYDHLRSTLKKVKESAITFGNKNFSGLQHEISIDEISFSYPEDHESARSPQILDNVSLSLPKGKIVALVGASGAGKSTLADIIMGFQKQDSGEVLVDGVSLGTYDIHSYRQRIGYVPQKNELFHTTIMENMKWAKPDAQEDEIREACRLANLSSFIDGLPDGLDTIVGEHGSMLSGGQVQRLALARALLRKPDILIMDEATSALDAESEKLIQQSIEATSRNVAILIIAHRLSTIAKADAIYVLDSGKIVERGNFQHLMSLKGKFHHLVELQKL